MFRSLRNRLLLILALLFAAATASGYIMFALFQQSATAQIGQAEALAGRACDSIARSYRLHAPDWRGATPDLVEPGMRRNLTAVTYTALQDKPAIEGGLWQSQAGAFAYAFPTYEGSGPKTDVPQAEEARIEAISRKAQREDRPQIDRIESGAQTLLIASCPLSGPIPELSAWTMTRVHSLGGRTYWQLMAGLAILVLSVALASLMAGALTLTWSRQVGVIVDALAAVGGGQLPALAPSGERELDHIVSALNNARLRLIESHQQTQSLAQQVAASERLAAVGRVTAGVAHEFRNPLAAMRLRAEVATKSACDRKDQALATIISQVDRLEGIIGRLLTATESEPLHCKSVRLQPFLAACAEPYRSLAASRSIPIILRCETDTGWFDAGAMSRAVGNLVLNGLQQADAGSVAVTASRSGAALVLAVRNSGAGVPEALREHLFDPFVSGSPDRAGLGLAIVREVAAAHGGSADFFQEDDQTVFRIVLPCPAS